MHCHVCGRPNTLGNLCLKHRMKKQEAEHERKFEEAVKAVNPTKEQWIEMLKKVKKEMNDADRN